MHRGYLTTAFILAAITVALGAFGAHKLEDIAPPTALKTFDTAVRYQFYHVFALAVSGILYKSYRNKWIRTSGMFFLLGIFLFSGSLYLLTLSIAKESADFKWVGPITPIGGVFFILGWIYLAVGIRNTKKQNGNANQDR